MHGEVLKYSNFINPKVMPQGTKRRASNPTTSGSKKKNKAASGMPIYHIPLVPELTPRIEKPLNH